MGLSKTLLIRHLPASFGEEDVRDFLKHFGAKKVKYLVSKYRNSSTAFAEFQNECVAESVLHRLHQVKILDSCLTVEYVKNETNLSESPKIKFSLADTEARKNEKYHQEFQDRLSSWHSGFHFRQPIPCHLKYQYPPPEISALINIIKVLMAVPKFYTQVLHLMNKMNLPCPFVNDTFPHLPLDTHVDSFLRSQKIMEEKSGENLFIEEKKSSSESEMSSDDDESGHLVKKTSPAKQIVKNKAKAKMSKILHPIPLKATILKKTKFEDVFENLFEEKQVKKIKLNHNISSIDLGFDSSATEASVQNSCLKSSGFGKIHPVNKPVAESEKSLEIMAESLSEEENKCITETDLIQNRIPEKDRFILPVFKNYAEGAPTNKLYIKNLAKTVTNEDLKYIYGRYDVPRPEKFENQFHIRLMQEGRMKGQAFVTLQTVELAQKALKETNGYILKEKPLVVQFARSTK